jgi:REP element-mobilizing transposase RayT
MICWFGDVISGVMELSAIGEIVADEWQKTPMIRPTVTLDEWQIMPNHFHGILMIHESESVARSGRIPFVDWDRAMVVSNGKPVETTPRVVSTLKPNSLGSIIGQFKSACTIRIHNAGHPNFQWQSLYYDRIIRDQDELDRIRTYIRQNPRRWNSAKRPGRPQTGL